MVFRQNSKSFLKKFYIQRQVTLRRACCIMTLYTERGDLYDSSDLVAHRGHRISGAGGRDGRAGVDLVCRRRASGDDRGGTRRRHRGAACRVLRVLVRASGAHVAACTQEDERPPRPHQCRPSDRARGARDRADRKPEGDRRDQGQRRSLDGGKHRRLGHPRRLTRPH